MAELTSCLSSFLRPDCPLKLPVAHEQVVSIHSIAIEFQRFALLLPFTLSIRMIFELPRRSLEMVLSFEYVD